MRNLILVIYFLFFGIRLFSQGVVYINEDQSNGFFDLKGNVFFLIDSTDEYTFDQVLSDEFETKFIQSEVPVFNYKRNAPSQWYKIRVQNNTTQIQQLILSLNNPLIDDIAFFNTFDSTYYYTGFSYPFNQRQVAFNNYLFKIKVLPGSLGVICFKIKSQMRPEYLPITLISESLAFDKLRLNAFVEGLFYCVILFFLFVILILWQSEKERMYQFLFVFVTFMLLVNLWRDGLLFQFLWPNDPNLNFKAGRILNVFLIFFLILFEYKFLRINKTNKYISTIFKIGLAITFAFGISHFFIDTHDIFYFGFRILLVYLALVTVWGLYLAQRLKIPFYNAYTFALSLIVGDLVFNIFFLSESQGFGFYDAQISTFIDILFFFIIIYIFISKFKSSRLEVIGLNKNLEQLVEKRTFQLNAQKEELKSQHEELVQQKETLQNQREELRAKTELLELNNSELAKLSLVASKTDNLIYIFLPNGELDWFNASFSSHIGLSIEEYQRGVPLSIVDVSSNKNIRHVLNTCLREKIVVSYESLSQEPNQPDRWYHTTLTPILDERENISYLIAIDTDITRLKKYENELDQQRKDAEHQKNLAVIRKEELEERQLEITDSIRYAKRIQTGIMPKVKQIQRDFADSFVLFLPKDIVSGDFYWYHRIKDKYFIAAVDCTGHGVPGAFMSIISTYLLNSIIIYNEVTDAAEILKQLNRKIKIALKSDGRTQTSDGMDISIAIIDKNENTVEFASALRPIYMFSAGDFIEVKGDKIPITSSISGTTISSFTKYNYPFNDGDIFYLFSDGIIDQFGGKGGKKFLTKRFKQLLFEINPLSMTEQKEIIKKAFDDWRGDAEQVDDVLVMGIRNKENMMR